MITVLVMVAVLIASMMVFGLGSQLQQSIRQVRYIQDDTQHLYFSEQVFAMLVNRLKQSGWNQRFYYKVEPPQSSEAGSGKLGGLGSVDEPTYEWFVQDVMDQVGGIRRDLTDVFVKVTYLGAVQSFMQRVRFRQPSNVRPTAALVQRFARIGREREFLDPLIRDELVAAADRDERLRLANRATHRVIGRVMRGMARRDMPVAAAVATLLGERMERPGPVASDGGGSVLSWLLRLTASPVHAGVSADEKALGDNLPDAQTRGRKLRGAAAAPLLPIVSVEDARGQLQAEITREQGVLDLWTAGEAALAAIPRDFAVARERFTASVAAAAARDEPHKAETLPRSLFLRAKTLTLQADALGDGPWNPAEPTAQGMQALTCGEPSSAPAGADARTRARLAHLAEAALDYQRITQGFPGGRDAAHAWIPWGWLAVRAVLDPGIDPANPTASLAVPVGVWNQARQCAYTRFEQLRAQEPYRQYHLWGEGAMTTRLPLNPDPAAHDPGLDELVYYERELVKPRLAVVFNSVIPGTWSLMLTNPDGTESVPVFSAADMNDVLSEPPEDLKWSAAGDSLLFLGRTPAFAKGIFEYDLCSNQLRQLTNNTGEQVGDFELVERGEHIVKVIGNPDSLRLILLDRKGERVEQLVSHISHYHIERHGTMLYYRRRVGEAWGWYQRELRDANSERALALPDTVTSMAVSPDRGRIAWVDLSSPASVVISKTQDGAEERRFDLGPVVPVNMEWSADQTKLRWKSRWTEGFARASMWRMWVLDLLTGEKTEPFGPFVRCFTSSPVQQ